MSECLKLNLNALYELDKTIAVWCPDKERALQFIKELRRIDPHRFRYWSGCRSNDENWREYKGSTCYIPHMGNFDTIDYFQYSSIQRCVDNGYEILKLDDLVGYPDCGEIELANIDITALFR